MNELLEIYLCDDARFGCRLGDRFDFIGFGSTVMEAIADFDKQWQEYIKERP